MLLLFASMVLMLLLFSIGVRHIVADTAVAKAIVLLLLLLLFRLLLLVTVLPLSMIVAVVSRAGQCCIDSHVVAVRPWLVSASAAAAAVNGPSLLDIAG